jgi:hypothetical protein
MKETAKPVAGGSCASKVVLGRREQKASDVIARTAVETTSGSAAVGEEYNKRPSEPFNLFWEIHRCVFIRRHD